MTPRILVKALQRVLGVRHHEAFGIGIHRGVDVDGRSFGSGWSVAAVWRHQYGLIFFLNSEILTIQ